MGKGQSNKPQGESTAPAESETAQDQTNEASTEETIKETNEETTGAPSTDETTDPPGDTTPPPDETKPKPGKGNKGKGTKPGDTTEQPSGAGTTTYIAVNRKKLDEIIVALLHGHTSHYTGIAVVTHVRHLFDLETNDQAREMLQRIQQRKAKGE